MSVLSAFLIMGLVLLAIVLLCFGVTRMEKTAKSSEFDERQQLVRGRGYRLAFWFDFPILLVTLTLSIAQMDGPKMVELYLVVFGGFLIQSLVFHVYCVINQASLPVSQKPLVNFIGFLFMGILWLYSFFNSQERCPLSAVGHGSFGWIELMGSFYMLSLSLLYLIQLLRREKE